MDTKITDGGGSFLQNISYNYNERGWLLASSAPLFEMQLQYNNITGVTGITPMAQYNGNIASQSWGTSASPNTKSYTYLYDNLNRLTSGISTDNFSERGITYDLNGNIQTLQRTYGSTTPIDNLVYTYNGTNQVQSINDSAPDNSNYGYRPGLYNNYRYDVNGNMSVLPTPPNGSAVADIDIQYNLLNLPQTITGGKTVTYTYDATGNKLRRVSPVTGSTDYINGIQYDQAPGATAPTLSFIQTEEGKAVPLSTGGYDYYYYMGDNLGNTRITFDTKAGTAVVLQQDDYLPFGYEISRNTVTSPKNEYLYNKKELQEELAEYDYGARFYDPVIGRWTSVDPMSEKMRRYSPYNYGFDNPIRFEDPDGMVPTDYYNENGDKVKHVDDGKDDKKIVLTTSSREKKVDAAIANGSVINEPSDLELNKMDDAYTKSESSGKEEKFVMGKDGKASITVEGSEGEVNKAQGIKAVDDLVAQGDVPSHDDHVHPLVKDADGNVTSYGLAKPSDTDKQGTGANQNNVVLGYREKVTMPDANTIGGTPQRDYIRSVGFYNKGGLIGPAIDLSTLKQVVQTINNPKP